MQSEAGTCRQDDDSPSPGDGAELHETARPVSPGPCNVDLVFHSRHGLASAVNPKFLRARFKPEPLPVLEADSGMEICVDRCAGATPGNTQNEGKEAEWGEGGANSVGVVRCLC